MSSAGYFLIPFKVFALRQICDEVLATIGSFGNLAVSGDRSVPSCKHVSRETT